MERLLVNAYIALILLIRNKFKEVFLKPWLEDRSYFSIMFNTIRNACIFSLTYFSTERHLNIVSSINFIWYEVLLRKCFFFFQYQLTTFSN